MATPQLVTIVPQGGFPMTLVDAQGNPFATTGTGALVFSRGATLEDVTFSGTTNFDGDSAFNPAFTVGGDIQFYRPSPGVLTIAVSTNPKLTVDATGISVTGNIAYSGQLVGAFHTPMTTEGDLYYRDAVGPARLPRGANGTVLGSNGTTITWVAAGAGTVSSISQVLGETIATPNPITTVGSIGLANSGVVAAGYGSATQSVAMTVDAKGRITSASNVTVTPAVGSITGLGAGVATYLATPSSASFRGTLPDPTGSGFVVFSISPTIVTPTLVTPALGAATASSLAINGATLGSNTLAVTGTSAIFNTGVGTTVYGMRLVNTSGSANSAVALSLDPGNNGANTRDAVLRATNNGNVITLDVLVANAATPTVILSVAPTITRVFNTLGVGDIGNRLQISSGGGGAVFNQNDNSAIIFQSLGNELVRLNPTGQTVITAASTGALVVGPNGLTNPAFTVNSAAGSLTSGLAVIGQVAAGPAQLVVTSSAADSSMRIDAKGTGTISIGTVSTGNIIMGRQTVFNVGASGPGTVTNLVIRTQTFIANGTYTPHANMVYCMIECWGGGGGGGGAATAVTGGQAATGGGGGAGGHSVTFASRAAVLPNQAVSIGAAGIAGIAGANPGGGGGPTSVGSLCIANGGSGGAGCGGASTSVAPGGAGGTAGTGDIATVGESGDTGFTFVGPPGTRGGTSTVGSAGLNAWNGATSSSGGAALGRGSGGGGGYAANGSGNAAGGVGTAGFVSIIEWCTA